MNSEKVKEIKKALEDNKTDHLPYIDGYKCKFVDYFDILTLINELESEKDNLYNLNQNLISDKQVLIQENERLQGVLDIANEREHRKKFNDEWRKEYQKELDKQGNGHIAGYPDFDLVYKLYFEQKDRIAELEKEKEENAFYSKGYAQGIKNTYEVVIPDKLKHFTEGLKEKFNDTEYRAKTKRKTISVEELKAQMDWILHEVVIKNIDETLKEFIE